MARRGRPKGAKRDPSLSTLLPKERHQGVEVTRFKRAIIELLEKGEVVNLSQAAEKLGISKLRVHSWVRYDVEFKHLVDMAGQIVADSLIETLDAKKHILGLMFRIKKYRPEYRDNYQSRELTPELEKLLIELRRLAPAQPKISISAPKEPVIEAETTVLPEVLNKNN